MNELIQTFQGQLAGETQTLVNASEIYDVLKPTTRFNDWIARRIEQFDFIDGEDFYSKLSKGLLGRPKAEYHLSLDMAKELCLVENTEQGKKARRYFIDVEKQARQHIPAFLRRGADDVGSLAEHQLAVMRSVVLDAKPMWAKLKRYFEANLTQGEMRQLTGMGDSALRENLRHMTLAGLIKYSPNPKLSAAGSKGNAKRLVAKNVH